jgi:hypothetical protein
LSQSSKNSASGDSNNCFHKKTSCFFVYLTILTSELGLQIFLYTFDFLLQNLCTIEWGISLLASSLLISDYPSGWQTEIEPRRVTYGSTVPCGRQARRPHGYATPNFLLHGMLRRLLSPLRIQTPCFRLGVLHL